MKKFSRIVLSCLFVFLLVMIQQTVAQNSESDTIYVELDEYPSFPGGDVERFRFITNEITYPKVELKNGIQGLVVISFVVEASGELTNFEVLKGITPAINDEAMRVCKAMPDWIPGKVDDKCVRSIINLPIRFVVDTEKINQKRSKKSRKK
jgi:protein TonB